MNETNHPSSLATCTLIQDLLNVKDGGIYEAVVQLKQQLEAREREVMALTNECAALKNQEPKAWYIQIGDGWIETNKAEAEKWHGVPLVCSNLDSPATDAALREIKAQGVEEFIVWATAPSGFDTDLTTDDAQEFADELREGRV